MAIKIGTGFKTHLSVRCFAVGMSDEKSQGAELSMTEKRLLLALNKIGGFGTPEQLQEAMLPDAIAELSKQLKIRLGSAFSDTGITIGDSQRARIIEKLLDIETEDEFSLPDGDKEPFQQMTFTLADDQAEFIKDMLKKAKEDIEGIETFGNENSNGNALYKVVLEWGEQKI